MGIYERDYYRPEGPPAAMSMTATLIVVNVAAYILNMLLGENFFGHTLFDWMKLPGLSNSLPGDVFHQPWRLYTLLTYGFAHDPKNISHIVFNMFGLWCFGRDIEAIYGRMEYLRLYLVAIFLGGLALAIPRLITGQPGAPALGASAGVLAVVMLYVLHFPQRQILMMLIIPMPAWAVGVLYIVLDVAGVAGNDPSDHVAHGAHLAGAAWAFVYKRSGINLGSWLPRDWRLWKWRPKPKLRVHDPEIVDELDDRDLQQRVDEILAKIHRSGEDSLTKQERQLLERASRRYQRRRRG